MADSQMIGEVRIYMGVIGITNRISSLTESSPWIRAQKRWEDSESTVLELASLMVMYVSDICMSRHLIHIKITLSVNGCFTHSIYVMVCFLVQRWLVIVVCHWSDDNGWRRSFFRGRDRDLYVIRLILHDISFYVVSKKQVLQGQQATAIHNCVSGANALREILALAVPSTCPERPLPGPTNYSLAPYGHLYLPRTRSSWASFQQARMYRSWLS